METDTAYGAEEVLAQSLTDGTGHFVGTQAQKLLFDLCDGARNLCGNIAAMPKEQITEEVARLERMLSGVRGELGI